MCGIFGVLQHEGTKTPGRGRLEETARLMGHRGPDGYGIFADAGIGLVHTRLSLVDLDARSNQPFWDETGRFSLVYNGEIYNFRELKAELQNRGIRFRTTSDTEVLLQCLIHLGVEATLPRLEGMFAFAWYDTAEKTLVLARDRFGIKPLLVYDEDDRFMFASEVQALRPWLSLRPDLLSISSYLQGFGGPTQGHTFYDRIQIVPPGSLIKVQIGSRAEFGRFFALSDFWDPGEAEAIHRLKPKQVVDKVEETLLTAVKSQLFADTAVGGLCSGGVDSSIVMAMAARFHNNLAVFHADVVGPLSEFEAAAALAKHLRLDLKAARVYDQDFIDLMPEVTEHYGHPFSFKSSSIPFYKVSQLVRGHGVKAVLCGEGSDECFLGYQGMAPNFFRLLRRFPEQSVRRLAHGLKKWRQRWKPRRNSHNLIRSDFDLVLGLHNRFECDLETAEIPAEVATRNGCRVPERDLKTLHAFTYNLRSLMHRNDSMGMAAGIESRFPFLDTPLVKLAVNMPYNCKVRFSPAVFEREHPFLRDKWALRQVAARYLPSELSQRKKLAFPNDAFLRMRIRERFFDRSLVADSFGLSRNQIRYLLERASYAFKLRLLHLEVWVHVCLQGLPKADMLRKLRDNVTVTPAPVPARRGRVGRSLVCDDLRMTDS